MDRAQSVSESELTIMRIIWREGGTIMLAPLMDALATEDKHWKANTVLTFLTRLADKGMLQVDKVGRLNQYTALVTEEAYMHAMTQAFLSDVYGGDAKGLIASLMQQEHITRDDIDELRTYWEGARGDD